MPVNARLSSIDVLLRLRSSTVFADVDPAILAVVAKEVRPRAFAVGELVYRAGEPVTAMQLVTQGGLRVQRTGGQTAVFGPGEVIGVLPLLAQVPIPFDARAKQHTVTLELRSDAFFDILDDHFPLLEHLLRTLCRGLINARGSVPDNAGYSSPVESLTCPTRSLDLVERIIVLRRALPLARTSIDALAELSRHMTELRLGPGERLWERGAPSDSLLIPVCGSVVCTTGESQTYRIGSGTIVGVLDALGAVPRWCEVTTEQALVALRVKTGHFFDVLDNELTLATALLASLAAEAVKLLADAHGIGWILRSGVEQRPVSGPAG